MLEIWTKMFFEKLQKWLARKKLHGEKICNKVKNLCTQNIKCKIQTLHRSRVGEFQELLALIIAVKGGCAEHCIQVLLVTIHRLLRRWRPIISETV